MKLLHEAEIGNIGQLLTPKDFGVVQRVNDETIEVDLQDSPKGDALQSQIAHVRRVLSLNDRNHLIEVDDRQLLEILTMASSCGLLEDTSDIHISDLCGGNGHAGLLLALLRGSQSGTSVDCIDSSDGPEKFEFSRMVETLKRNKNMVCFSKTDLTKVTPVARKDRNNYWFAQRPMKLSNVLLNRLCTTEPEKRPRGAVFLPSEAYCYSPKDMGAGELGANPQWTDLAQIRGKFQLDFFGMLRGERLSSERAMMVDSLARLMNGVRAMSFNRKAVGLKAHLQATNFNRDLIVVRSTHI